MRLEAGTTLSGLITHNILLGLLATLLMLWSAVFMYIAARGAKLGDKTLALAGLSLSMVLSVAYLAVTGLDWISVFAAGFTLADPAIATSATTALAHVLHLLAGLLVALYLALKIWVRGFTGHVPDTVDSLAVYWGFLAAVSVLIFGVTYVF